MGFIWKGIVWVVFGFIVGALARFLMPGKQPMSMLMQAGLGIAGSIIGGTLYTVLFESDVQRANFVTPGGWFTSVLGAFLLLWIVTLINNKKAGS